MVNKENCKREQYQDEPIEIVKRIENPYSQHEEEQVHETQKPEKTPEPKEVPEAKEVPQNMDEHYYYNNDEEIYKDYKEKNKPAKKGLKTLFTLTAVGIVGYFGLNSLNKNNENETQSNQIQETSATQMSEGNNTKKEEIFYVEALSVKTKSDEATATPIVALSSSNSSKNKIVDSNITPIKEVQKEEVVKEEKPKEEKTVAQIESVKKIEKEEPKPISKIESVERVVKKETQKIQYEKIKARFTRVRSGDSLASIAKRFYGNPMDFKRIIRANSRIRNKNTSLRLGEKIIIPRKDNKRTRRFVIVKRGNTLASIAKSVYGTTDKMSKIVRANYRIKSKYSTLRLGQKVYVPR
jgi:nucleoid-associated protein YgaU